MNTTDDHAHDVVGLKEAGPAAVNGHSNGSFSGPPAGSRHSPGGLEQRVAELEQQVADLTARNAELVRVNDERAQAERMLQEVLRSTRCILNSGEAERPEAGGSGSE